MAKKVKMLQSGGKETGPAAGGKLARAREGLRGSPFPLYVALPGGVAVVAHMLGRAACRLGYIEPYVADSLTLGGLVLMLVSSAFVMHRLYRVTSIMYVTLVGAACIVVGQALNVVDHSTVWSISPPGEAFAGLHVFFKETCFVVGISLLLGVYVLSLIESNRIRRALTDAYADVERQVNERTASLVEANQKLGEEICVRRGAEDALRLSEEKFRALVENSADIILRLDTDLHILYANPTVTTAMGADGNDLKGRTVTVLLGSGHDAEAWHRAARQVIASGKPERVASSPDDVGAFRLLDWSLAPETGTGGEVTSLLAVARDMTELWHKEAERRALEEQLVQLQKLESIGRLAGGVAHDFNNLLQVIRGYLEIAMAEVDCGHSAQGRLRQVDRAARRATTLVRQLLAFSRRETMRCEHIDLNRLVFDLAKMLRRVLGEQYEINIEASLELPLVYADAGHVEQVLMNLCLNARDAMSGGGAIRIKTRAVHVSEDAAGAHPNRIPGDYVEVIVSDSGLGMTPEVLSRVFEPFFTTKETGKGTGLGLAVVYGIVRQHGGFLDVSSRPGVGSDFSIFLPAAPEGAVEAVTVEEAPRMPDGAGETILLAEDDELVRGLAANILEKAGYRVVEAREGLETVTLIGERGAEIDLFMLDAIMPLKTGREMYDAIIALRPEARILFFTGQSFNTPAEINLPEAGYELLHKPFSANDLLSRVRKILDGQGPL